MQKTHQALASDLLDSLTRISRKLRTTFNARVTEHGLTYSRARTLLRLREHTRLTQTKLAVELELETPTIGRMLDRMEALDLVARKADVTDRRANQVELTARGRTQADLVVRIGQQIRDEFFVGLSPDDMRRTIALLKIVDGSVGGMSDRNDDPANDGSASPRAQP